MMVDNAIVKIWASDIKHMLNSLVNLDTKSWNANPGGYIVFTHFKKEKKKP